MEAPIATLVARRLPKVSLRGSCMKQIDFLRPTDGPESAIAGVTAGVIGDSRFCPAVNTHLSEEAGSQSNLGWALLWAMPKHKWEKKAPIQSPIVTAGFSTASNVTTFRRLHPRYLRALPLECRG